MSKLGHSITLLLWVLQLLYPNLFTVSHHGLCFLNILSGSRGGKKEGFGEERRWVQYVAWSNGIICFLVQALSRSTRYV